MKESVAFTKKKMLIENLQSSLLTLEKGIRQGSVLGNFYFRCVLVSWLNG